MTEKIDTSLRAPGHCECCVSTASVLKYSQGTMNEESCAVVVERPLTIRVEGVGDFTIMCTPCDTMALAMGFLYSEGLIHSASDVSLLYVCQDDPGSIRVRLTERVDNPQQRNLIVSSSCGLCGSTDIEGLLSSLPKCTDDLRLDVETVFGAVSEMQTQQHIFPQTGGTHAAALFDAEGKIMSFAEDIGRHNALDKAVGKCLLQEIPTAGSGAVLSGRVSLEMVVKAARAGIELIAAVSAPTSLAVQAAETCGITLCGFVRGDRLTIYAHSHRVKGISRSAIGG